MDGNIGQSAHHYGPEKYLLLDNASTTTNFTFVDFIEISQKLLDGSL